ncbi:hypothetical protein DV737_g2314, partial [Chaetothyriales sp. CBS 132003]
MSPDSPDNSLSYHWPLQDRQRRIFPRSWKKIGSLFTAKHPTQKPAETPTNSDQVPYRQLPASKSDELLAKHSWFKYKVQIQEPPTKHPPSPPGKDVQHESDFIQKEAAKRMSSSNGKTMLLDPSPFSSPCPGEESGQLVKRPTRASTLPKLEISIPNQLLNIEDPGLKHAPAAPAPPSLLEQKGVSRIQQASPLKRSLTSPAQLSPMQSNFSTTKPHPLATTAKTLTEQDVTSPATNTASTETTAPWSAITSNGSSLSSSNTDEIFFDVKSFRDSRGMEDGKHFVMARPDSAVVELARTRSRLKSSAFKEFVNKPTPLANKEGPSPVSGIDAVAFDEAIAASTKPYLPQVKAIRRIDHPIQESPTIPQSPPLRLYSPAAAVALGNKPPPVPQKDAKYIPLSKYAARNTISKIELVGVRPARLDRAATDGFLSRADQAAKSAKGMRVERSATIPAPRSSSNLRIQTEQAEGQARISPRFHPQASSPSSPIAGVRALGHGGLHTVPTVVQAAPTAENSGDHNEKQVGEQHETENCDSIGPHSYPRSESTSTSTPTLTAVSPSISTKALSNLKPLGSHPMDSQVSLVSQVSQASQFSYQSDISTLSKAQEKVGRELIDKFKTKEKEVQEGMRMSPVVVVEGLKGHKPGASVGVVLDTA